MAVIISAISLIISIYTTIKNTKEITIIKQEIDRVKAKVADIETLNTKKICFNENCSVSIFSSP